MRKLVKTPHSPYVDVKIFEVSDIHGTECVAIVPCRELTDALNVMSKHCDYAFNARKDVSLIVGHVLNWKGNLTHVTHLSRAEYTALSRQAFSQS